MYKISFFVRLTVCLLFVFLPLQSMDKWFYDLFFRLRFNRPHPTQVVTVRVSDTKLYQLLEKENIHFPRDEFALEHSHHSIWHKHFYETILDKIESDSPRLVIFTSFFEWVDTRTPTTFKYNNILLSSTINDENKVSPPPSRLWKGDNFGFNNIFPDPDNIVRKTNLIYSSSSSLALKAHQDLIKEPIRRNLIDPFWIDYLGPEGTYPSYDAWELYEEPSTNGRYRDKIVLIGRDGSPSSNLETPYGPMSPIEIHANTIDTFLKNQEIHIAPHFTSLIIAAIAVGISVFIILYFPLTLAWFLLPLFAITLILMTLFLFSELKIWSGIANPLFCIFGTHLLMIGYKVSRQEEEQWRINQQSKTLREMDQFKNNFISLFSHDLKTPISKIKAVTDRLLTNKAVLSEDMVDSLRSIDKTNAELSRSISDILKVTKMESMTLEIKKDVIDLNRLVEATIQRLKFLADEKQITLRMDLEPLFSIEGDQHLIQEVIINLVENAIKYSLKDTQVIIRTREVENQVIVSVIDQGIGIMQDEIPRVTSKFFRGRNGIESTKGSGLGLYLAKYFVELHQGHLDIKSELGKGTEVSFTIPLPS